MCLTLYTVPMSHTSYSAVLIIWIAYENEGPSSLWNFTCSEQIIFTWVLAGRISNMLKEQWRYRAKVSWWDELQKQGGMQIQMSESDTKMLLEVGQPLSTASSCKSTSVTWSLQWLLLNGQNSLSSVYMKQYSERLIMTNPSISN